MIKAIFGDIGFWSAKKGLDVSSLRQKVIAQNVANVTTPGYGAMEVKFEEILQEKLKFKLSGSRTHPMHLPIGRARITEVEPEVVMSSAPIPPGKVNNVEIDKEMVELAKNSLNWDAYTNLLSFKYRLLTQSIRR